MPELRRFTLSLYISLLITVLCSIQAFAVDTEIIYDYDGSGQIRTVIYSNDLTINFGYDSSGNILLKTINSGPISNLPPSPVIYLEPEDQAIGQTLHPVLRWQAATDPESPENIIYNIYLSKSSPPSIYSRGQTETRLDVLRLEPETTYYWQINSIDPHNASSIGPIWSFTTGPDTDHDTVLDTQDNCPALYNKTQTDTDNDQYGDSCDEDDDNDSIADTTDNCPLHYNPLQTDTDLDGPGDACDSDDDEDYILDIDDNCPLLQNTNQADLDNDNIGDICDPDIDGDGYENATDVCPVLPDPDQHDSDANGYGDACTVTVCVSDSYGLRMALDNARSSSKDYVIKLQQGIYKVSESGRTRFSYNSIQPHRLNIQGGYSQSCTEQFSDPALSILDGEAQYEVLNLTDNSASPYPRNIRVENLTVTNGIRGLYVSSQKRDIELSNLIVSNNSNSGSGGGISLNSPEGISILKNSIIQGNSADFYAGIQATTKYGLLVFINNIVTDNTAAYNGGGISANLQTAGRVVMVNNTISNNVTTAVSGRGSGLFIENTSESATADIYNNIILGNSSIPERSEIYIPDSLMHLAVWNNNYDPDNYTGLITSDGNNINTEPGYIDPVNKNYHLSASSECIDAGNSSAPFLPPYDFEGDNRIIGSLPDIGADEFRITNIPPTAHAGGPYYAVEGEQLILDASGSTDADGTIMQYEWDIDNDGAYDHSTTIPFYQYTFQQNGTHIIKLKITDDVGSEDISTAATIIADTVPVAYFIAGPVEGLSPLSVNFTDLSMGHDKPFSYEWDFDNDGIIDSGLQNPMHIYNSVGKYSVKLKTRDSDNSESILTRIYYINVTEQAHVLSVSKSGTGNGIITSSPEGINCGAACSTILNLGNTISLTAVAEPDSLFAAWDHPSCTDTQQCDLIITSDMNITAEFTTCPTLPVRLDSPSPSYFNSLQSAYDAAQTGDTIRARAGGYNEALDADRTISITISGGYDCAHENIPGRSILNGDINLINGTAVIENFIIGQ